MRMGLLKHETVGGAEEKRCLMNKLKSHIAKCWKKSLTGVKGMKGMGKICTPFKVLLPYF
jgi:hypothetical protein